MTKKVAAEIKIEIESIEFLLAEYGSVIHNFLGSAHDKTDDLAVAAVLHSFYGGLENIFQRIAKRIDFQLPPSEQWHTGLLDQMTSATDKRPRLLSTETATLLKDYLQFRHFFRHNYLFVLEHERLEKLVRPLLEIWKQTRGEIEEFVRAIEPAQK